ncbi:viral ankyrin V1, partial [Microplitis demolitor]
IVFVSLAEYSYDLKFSCCLAEMELLSWLTNGLKEILLEQNSEGENFFHEVARSGSFSLLSRFAPYVRGFDAAAGLNTRNHNGQMALHVAAVTHDKLYAVKLIQVLKELGADINGQEGAEGNTVLHLAVSQQRYELAEWLSFQEDIDLEIRNNDNLTPLEMAKSKKDKKMMKILKNGYNQRR